MTLRTNDKILIISPHPDDETIGCGGLIMIAKKKLIPVRVIYCSIGTSRQLITGKTSIKTRLPEIKRAAKTGNFSYTILFRGSVFMKLDTLPQKTIIDKIEDEIQSFKPTIVLVPYGGSYDQDHRAVHTATITALRPVPQNVRHFPQTVMEYFEPYDWPINQSHSPTLYIDISNYLDDKLNLFFCHKTQVREDPFPRSLENLRRLSQHWGTQIGTKAAEAYSILREVMV